MEMTDGAKPGNQPQVFHSSHRPWKSLGDSHIPTASNLPLIYRETKQVRPKSPHLRINDLEVGQIKLPKWAEISCQTHGAVFKPVSLCFKMAKICSSVNLVRFISLPLPAAFGRMGNSHFIWIRSAGQRQLYLNRANGTIRGTGTRRRAVSQTPVRRSQLYSFCHSVILFLTSAKFRNQVDSDIHLSLVL